MSAWGPLILRISLAIVFLAHGAQALFGSFDGPGISGFAQVLATLGFKPALFWAYIGAITEFVGGLCLVLGIVTRIAAGFLLIFITVATIAVHLPKGFFLQHGGSEYNVLIASVCIALMLTGPGKFSIQKKW